MAVSGRFESLKITKLKAIRGRMGCGAERETHILSDVSLVPISKLQGIVLRVSQAPPVGSGGSIKQIVGGPSIPLPAPWPGCPPALTRRTPPSIQQPRALPASGAVTPRVRNGEELGRNLGEGWGGLLRGEGGDPEVNGGRTSWLTWSSWISCGMASRIWTAIFTTFRGGAMVQPGQRAALPRLCNLPLWSTWSGEANSLLSRAWLPLHPTPPPNLGTHRPRSHS